MLKKFSTVVASIVALAFVTVSITHACSGLASMNPAVQQSPMKTPADNSPCGEEKPDICKSVRDTLLSVKPSVLGLESPEKTVPQPAISFVNPVLLGTSTVDFVIKIGSHPVFKLPLTVSYRVLRI